MLPTHLLDVAVMLILFVIIFYRYNKTWIQEHITKRVIRKLKYGNIKVICGDEIIYNNIENDTEPVPRLCIREEYRKEFFKAINQKHEIGLGESYVDGYWYSDDIESLMVNIYSNIECIHYEKQTYYSKSISQDKKHIAHHYDVGNDFYQSFLTDPLMAYSCGIWNDDTNSLADSQYNKVNTIICKIHPRSGQRILDIGCGWGCIAKYIADQTETHVTGITISEKQVEQIELQLLKDKQTNVDFKAIDYRYINSVYDHIYSIGMFEHVRLENYDEFFRIIKSSLKQSGRFVLHTIIKFDRFYQTNITESFVTKHIFPGGQIPSPEWIINAVQRNGLRILHIECFGGQHYAKTLQEWRKNLMSNRKMIETKYGPELIRRYDYYFSSCYALFTLGELGIAQFVITNQTNLNLKNNYIYQHELSV
jgi:cyclopropane-fatty-acyl-phospholipid synthase